MTSSADERFVLLLTTTGSDEQANGIARELVRDRLAACVNVVGPIRSVYRWQGEIHSDEERLLIVKTSERLAPRTRERIVALHAYDVPEVLVVPIADGDPRYLAWLANSLDEG